MNRAHGLVAGVGALAAAVVALSVLSGAGSDARTRAPASSAEAPFPVNIDLADFDETSATIDNRWWPLVPGTQLTWEGKALDGEEVVHRRIVFTVTDLTKEIAGVRTLVGWDRDFNDGALAESELFFVAQDKRGNVWHFGEYAELYDEEGQFDGASSWMVGYLEGAKAGIVVPGSPTLGSPAFAQGYAPSPYYWDDLGRVYRTGQRTCVKAGCYNDVLVIEEFEEATPDAFQLKYYAPGVGNVRVGWRGEDEEHETLELVSIVRLTPEQLAVARAEALRHEARGRVYGTAPVLAPR